MKFHGLITGNSYQDDQLNIEVRAEEKQSLALVEGDRIELEFSPSRECIGYRSSEKEGSSLLECPEAVVGITSSQCENCLGRANILPCLRCTGDVCRNAAKRDFCIQPDNHALYLASFASGVIKVGVSRWERRTQRLLEQGAKTAIIVAQNDGQMIRRYEALITKFGYIDRLTSSEKLGYLSRSASTEELLVELHQALDTIRLRMNATWIEPEVIELPDYPSIPGLEFSKLWKPNKKGDSASILKAEIVNITGRLLILKDLDANNQQPIAVDVKDLVGYRVQPASEDSYTSGQMQLSLF